MCCCCSGGEEDRECLINRSVLQRNLQQVRDEAAGREKAFAIIHCAKLRVGQLYRGGRVRSIKQDPTDLTLTISPGVVVVSYNKKEDKSRRLKWVRRVWYLLSKCTCRSGEEDTIPLLRAYDHDLSVQCLGRHVGSAAFKNNYSVVEKKLNEQMY